MDHTDLVGMLECQSGLEAEPGCCATTLAIERGVGRGSTSGRLDKACLRSVLTSLMRSTRRGFPAMTAR